MRLLTALALFAALLFCRLRLDEGRRVVLVVGQQLVQQFRRRQSRTPRSRRA